MHFVRFSEWNQRAKDFVGLRPAQEPLRLAVLVKYFASQIQILAISSKWNNIEAKMNHSSLCLLRQEKKEKHQPERTAQ